MSKALAFMSGLSQGYLDMVMRNEDYKDREEDKKWRQEHRARMRKDWDREDALKDAVAAAAKPGALEDASVYSPAVDDNGLPMPANPTAGRVSMGGQTFNSAAEAQPALDAYNAPQARMSRVADAYGNAGEVDKAMAIQTGMRQSKVADIQAKQIEEQAELQAKLREVGGLLVKGGWGAVPEIYGRYRDGFDAKVEEDGKGGATVITLKGGKEVSRDQFGDLTQLYERIGGMFDPSLWVAGEQRRGKEAREAAKDKSEAEYKAGMLGVAQQNAATNEGYRRDMANTAARNADTAAAKASSRDVFERMPEVEKIAFTSLNRQIETIQTEIIKAQAGGMADPTAINGLRAQAAGLQMRANAILAKHQPAGSAVAAPDPLGLRSPQPAQPPVAPQAAMGQPAAAVPVAAPAQAPRAAMAPPPPPKAPPPPVGFTGDPALKAIEAKRAGKNASEAAQKAELVAVYEAEVARAEDALRNAVASGNQKAVSDAAQLVTQARQAVDLVKGK